MMKTVPLAEAKAKLSGLVDEVTRRDERVTITKHGKPAAVLLSHRDMEGLEATLEIMGDPDFYAQILRGEEQLKKGKYRVYEDLDELLGEEGPVRRAKASPRRRGRGPGRAPAPPAHSKAKGRRSPRRAAKRPVSR